MACAHDGYAWNRCSMPMLRIARARPHKQQFRLPRLASIFYPHCSPALFSEIRIAPELDLLERRHEG